MAYEMLIRSVAPNLYVNALTSAWRSGVQIYDPSLWLYKEPEIDEKMMRDADIAHVVHYRTNLVAGSEWGVLPHNDDSKNGKRAAKCAEELIKHIRHFAQARRNLSMAFLSGARYSEIRGKEVILTIGDGKRRKWWVPTQLKDVDKRLFRLVRDDLPKGGMPGVGPSVLTEAGNLVKTPTPEMRNEHVKVHWEKWSVAQEDWFAVDAEGAAKVIKHAYMDDEGSLGHGRGLRDALGWWWYAKEHVFAESLEAVERFAQGIITAKIAGLRDANSKYPNEELVNKWTKVLEDMRARHILVFDQEDEVEMVKMDAQGWQLLSDIRDELRDTIFRLVLGGRLPTGGGSDEAGSLARAEVEQDSTEALISFDREILEETLTDDLISYIWYKNWRNICELGLHDEPLPRFSIVKQTKYEPGERATTAKALTEIGLPLAERDLYEQTGFKEPDDGDRLVEPPPQPDPFTQGGQFPGGAPQMGGAPNGASFRAQAARVPDGWEACDPDQAEAYVEFGTYSVRTPDIPQGQPRCDAGQPVGGEYAPQDCEGGGGETGLGIQTQDQKYNVETGKYEPVQSHPQPGGGIGPDPTPQYPDPAEFGFYPGDSIEQNGRRYAWEGNMDADGAILYLVDEITGEEVPFGVKVIARAVGEEVDPLPAPPKPTVSDRGMPMAEDGRSTPEMRQAIRAKYEGQGPHTYMEMKNQIMEDLASAGVSDMRLNDEANVIIPSVDYVRDWSDVIDNEHGEADYLAARIADLKASPESLEMKRALQATLLDLQEEHNMHGLAHEVARANDIDLQTIYNTPVGNAADLDPDKKKRLMDRIERQLSIKPDINEDDLRLVVKASGNSEYELLEQSAIDTLIAETRAKMEAENPTVVEQPLPSITGDLADEFDRDLDRKNALMVDMEDTLRPLYDRPGGIYGSATGWESKKSGAWKVTEVLKDVRARPWSLSAAHDLKAALDAMDLSEVKSMTGANDLGNMRDALSRALGDLPELSPERERFERFATDLTKEYVNKDSLISDWVSLEHRRELDRMPLSSVPTQADMDILTQAADKAVSTIREDWSRSGTSNGQMDDKTKRAAALSYKMEKARGLREGTVRAGNAVERGAFTRAWESAEAENPGWSKTYDGIQRFAADLGGEATYVEKGGLGTRHALDPENVPGAARALRTAFTGYVTGLRMAGEAGFLPSDLKPPVVQGKGLIKRGSNTQAFASRNIGWTGKNGIHIKHNMTEKDMIKAASPGWTEGDERAGEKGFSLMGALVVHETGHFLHTAQLSPTERSEAMRGYGIASPGQLVNLSPEDRFALAGLPETELTRYGSSHRMELIAETYTRMVLGKPVDPVLMRVYRKHGGYAP